jgi:protein-disulfide isomerase
MSKRLLLLPFLALAVGCNRTPQAADSSPTAHAAGPDAKTVVAELEGTSITLSELDAAVAGEMSQIRHQEYEIRKRGLDRMIEDRLIDKEAQKRGLTREALLKAEIEDKVSLPADGEVAMLYEQYKTRFIGKSKDEAMEIIRQSLRRQGMGDREREFRSTLRQGRNIKVALDAPRAKVTVPAEAYARGPADAKVTMVEFLDYGCGFCKRAHATVEELMKKYDGKIRFVHRDYPLSADGPTVNAARGVHCAADQKKTWEYHADLLTEPGSYDDADLNRRAGKLGLDGKAFGACLASKKYDERIQQSAEAGQELGVNSTPTFFINGRRVAGAQPFEVFTEIIDAELAAGS